MLSKRTCKVSNIFGRIGQLSACTMDPLYIVQYSFLFTCVSIFSNREAAIKPLSSVVNNFKIGRECRSYLNLICGYSNVTITWVSGHCDISLKCKAGELASAGSLFPESFSNLNLGMLLNSFKLAITRKFSRDAYYLSWILIHRIKPSMDSRRTNQLFGLDCNITSIIVLLRYG